MKKYITLASVLALTQPLSAQTLSNATALGGWHQISATGYWSAYGGRNDHNMPQCAAYTEGKFGTHTTTFSVKYDTDHPDMMGVEIAKDDWNIPKETQMRVVLQVDNVPGRYFYGHGGVETNEIEIDINTNDNDPTTGEPAVNLLFNLLKNGKTLNIWFPDGSEPEWTADLTGANTTINDFMRCMKTIVDFVQQLPQSNQPATSGGGGSQPYTNPAPTPRQTLPPTQATNPYQKL